MAFVQVERFWGLGLEMKSDEDDKVDLVLKRFQAVPASRAEDNMLQKLVGRVVLAGNPFYAPANNMVCWDCQIEWNLLKWHF